MKVKNVTKNKSNFKEITLKIKIESIEELRDLRRRLLLESLTVKRAIEETLPTENAEDCPSDDELCRKLFQEVDDILMNIVMDDKEQWHKADQDGLRLKVWRKYISGEGNRIQIIKKCNNRDYPFFGDNGDLYTTNGKYYDTDNPSSKDLMREVEGF